jgi:Cu+-exporting ATPase
MTETTTTLSIAGMTCASCVGRVERALAALPGVRRAEVNLATETARVTHGAEAGPAVLAGALARAGYPAAEAEAKLVLEGMTCASCVARVEKALLAVPGVLSASVNLADETASLRYLDGAATPDDLLAAVVRAGYGARLEAGAAPDIARRKAAEAQALGRRLALAAALSLPVFLVEMGGHLVPALHHWIAASIGQQTSWVIQFVLATLVLAGPGRQFFTRGVPALLCGAPDMNALVALGTAAAWGFSVVATFWPSALPEGTRAVYFEASVVIVTLILLGRWLEARAKGRTGAAIERLVRLQPRTARVRAAGQVREVALEQIAVGDILELRPGERVAVDGEVTEGGSWIDESMITGEPLPVQKAPGDSVTGGTVNGTGALAFRATRVGADTMLAQIVRLVAEAQGARLPIQGLVDRITMWFVPAVLGAAALTVLAWLAFGPAPALGLALVAGVSVLIIACPCAMGLATPVSIMVGTGRAAEMGVLFRRGDALQSLQEARIVAFDKTGTLTAGRPELTDLHPAPGQDADTVLRLAAAVEARSEHPVAAAVVRAAEARGLPLAAAEDFEAIPGYGVRARVGGRQVLAGAARLMAREGIATGDLAARAATLAAAGATPLFVAVDGVAAAVIGVSDPVKPSTAAAVAALKAEGLRVVMITGDVQAAAEAIAARIGIDEVVAEVLPDGKVAALAELRAGGARLAFVGDGINDAPALAAADVGIAIGTGTDVAIEAADVVLLSGDLRGVVNAFEISRRTLANIRQNLFWAFGYNILLIPVAAGVLWPLTGMLLSPMLAAGAMALSSVFVLTNALRLRRVAPVMAEGAGHRGEGLAGGAA